MNPATPIIFVSIIEDNRFIRSGWEVILSAVHEFSVVGVFESCELAFETSAIEESDVVLMDIGLPGMSGIEGVRFIKENYPSTNVIMCSVYDDDQNVFDAICAGAVGYLLKKSTPEEIIGAIRNAMNGGSPMTPTIARKVLASFQPAAKPAANPAEQLSDRERDILQQMALGKSYASIGGGMFLSIDGVRYHIRHIYEKLHVHSRAEAISVGLRQRIIQPPK